MEWADLQGSRLFISGNIQEVDNNNPPFHKVGSVHSLVQYNEHNTIFIDCGLWIVKYSRLGIKSNHGHCTNG